MVTRRGEFAVRGGILDVFPPVAEHPVPRRLLRRRGRAIRAFSVADQRSLDRPSPTPSSCRRAASCCSTERCASAPARCSTSSRASRRCSRRSPRASRSRAWSRSRPALLDRLVPVTALPARGRGHRRALARARRDPRRQPRRDEPRVPRTPRGAPRPPAPRRRSTSPRGEFLTASDRAARRRRRPRPPWWTLSTFESGPGAGDGIEVLPEHRDIDEHLTVRIEADPVPELRRQRRRRARARALAASPTAGPWRSSRPGTGLVERAADVLAEHEVAARVVVELSPTTLEPGVAYLLQATVEHGFELPEIEARRCSASPSSTAAPSATTPAQVKKLASRRKNVVDPLQLKPGDYVVHQTHGIGQFVELVAARGLESGGRNAGQDHPRVPRDRVRAHRSAATRATSSTCRPTSSTCSPATSAARRRRCRRWAAATGRPPRARRARPSATSPSSS